MITRPNQEKRRDGLSAERPYLYGGWPGVVLIFLATAMVSYVVGWFGAAVVLGSGVLAVALVFRRRQ